MGTHWLFPILGHEAVSEVIKSHFGFQQPSFQAYMLHISDWSADVEYVPSF